jgi:histidinol phosphatase-like enzyme (inositol monophosphatase family)
MGAPPSIDQLLDDVTDLARTAGDATLAWFQRPDDQQIETKADGSPVTVADRTAERMIRETLATRYPHDGIVGEEEGTTSGSGTRRWIIDPIDGTQAFVRGVPLYATLVAVEDPDGVIAGAIHLPALGETVFAGRGLGCFHDGSPTKVSSVSDLDEFVFSASGYGYVPKDMLDRLHASPMRLRTWGDAYGYALVATGRIEAMADPIVQVWDLAPMMVIIPEAGGVFTDFAGRASYSSGNALATNGIRHDDVLRLVTGRTHHPE